MADARREHEYDVARHIIHCLGMSFNGALNSREVNPIRLIHQRTRPVTEDEYKAQCAEGWEMMRAGLLAFSEQRG